MEYSIFAWSWRNCAFLYVYFPNSHRFWSVVGRKQGFRMRPKTENTHVFYRALCTVSEPHQQHWFFFNFFQKCFKQFCNCFEFFSNCNFFNFVQIAFFNFFQIAIFQFLAPIHVGQIFWNFSIFFEKKSEGCICTCFIIVFERFLRKNQEVAFGLIL